MISPLLAPLLSIAFATALATVAVRREVDAAIAATLAVHAGAATMATVLVAIAGGTLEAGLYAGAFAALCVAVAWIDARTMIIPDVLVVGLGAIALMAPFRPEPFEQVLGAIVMGGVFVGVRQWHFAARGGEGLGLGDVKLAVVIGAVLGANMALLAAGLAAAIMAVWMIARGVELRTPQDGAMAVAAPFGVGLAGALGIAVTVVAIVQ